MNVAGPHLKSSGPALEELYTFQRCPHVPRVNSSMPQRRSPLRQKWIPPVMLPISSVASDATVEGNSRDKSG